MRKGRRKIPCNLDTSISLFDRLSSELILYLAWHGVSSSRKTYFAAGALARAKCGGGPALCDGQHIWLLIFLVLFVSRQKERNVHMQGDFLAKLSLQKTLGPYWIICEKIPDQVLVGILFRK